MDVGAYLIGCALLVVVLATVGYGAWSTRIRVLPNWTGGLARLSEIVIALATIVVVSEILGSFGWFRRAPVVFATSAAGLALGEFGRRRGTTTVTTTRVASARRTPMIEFVGATVGVAIVGAQWAGKVGFALQHGMTHIDTVSFHAPYAAKFVQSGHLLNELGRGDPLHAYASHTSELLHAFVTLCFGRDALSPLLNVGWAALALLAAWCVGKRAGVGALCVLGAAVVMGLPMIVATHPGQASNDVAAAALLLSAVALFVEGALSVPASACAGLAAGLAIGTKTTVAAPVAVLSVGVLFVAGRRGRPRAAAAWWISMVASGVYWFVRNAIVAHNPLPFYNFNFGVFRLSAAITKHDSVSQFLFHAKKWQDVFIPGFHVALGYLWPAVLASALAGSILCLRRDRRPLERVAGIALFAGLIAYLFTPYSADSGGLAFKYNVRFVVPSLLGAIVLMTLACADWATVARRVACAVMLAVIVVDVFGRNLERVPAWPAVAAVAAPVAAAVVIGTAATRYFVVAHGAPSWLPRGLAAGVLALFVATAWPIQRYAHDHRYVDAGLPLDSVNGAFVDIHHAKVAYFGTAESYPFYGTDLSNHVDVPRNKLFTAPLLFCRHWLQILQHYQYIVIVPQSLGVNPGPPPGVLAFEPGLQKLAGNANGNLYRVVGPLTGVGCSDSAS